MDQQQHDGQQQQSGGALAPRWLLWAGILVALAFLIIMFFGYLRGWKWTGLPGQTVWDWLDLLIVPTVLAIGGYLFTRSENRATQAAAERRAQDDALQAYLDNMSGMLIPNKDQPSLYDEPPSESLRTVARARTLTILPRLAGDRKARVVQFLYEASLITQPRPVVELGRADLRGADLRGADLSGADLSFAHLRGADLSIAHLREADLRVADLRVADLRGALLNDANMGGALLNDVNLREADLSGVKGWIKEQLTRASLEGATMPDGQEYEDWRKSKGRREDG